MNLNLFEFIFKVLSIECFEKIRRGQRIFPLKSLKGFRCIYNELLRKGSLPYLEQKRATTTSANTKKIPPLPSPSNPSLPKTNTNNSPPTSPKTLPKISEQQTSVTQKSSITNPIRSKITRSSDSFVSSSSAPIINHSLATLNGIPNDPMVMRYQTIQRYKTNFEMLKPATIIAEDWKNLDKTQKDRLGLGGNKTLVLVSKSPTPPKNNQIIQT